MVSVPLAGKLRVQFCSCEIGQGFMDFPDVFDIVETVPTGLELNDGLYSGLRPVQM